MLDTRPGITSNCHHPMSKTRIVNDDVSPKIRSKTSHIDQNVGVTPRSKLQGACNLSVQGLLFRLHDAIHLNGHRRFDDKNLRLGISDHSSIHSCRLVCCERSVNCTNTI